MFKDRVLDTMLGPKREKVRGVCRELYNEKLDNL
jgi:hypothetical protein